MYITFVLEATTSKISLIDTTSSLSLLLHLSPLLLLLSPLLHLSPLYILSLLLLSLLYILSLLSPLYILLLLYLLDSFCEVHGANVSDQLGPVTISLLVVMAFSKASLIQVVSGICWIKNPWWSWNIQSPIGVAKIFKLVVPLPIYTARIIIEK